MNELIQAVTSGPLLLAIAVAVLAGLVSFFSPCVLPLVPGYISYVTGLAGAELDASLGVDPLGRKVAAGVAAEHTATTAEHTATTAEHTGAITAGHTATTAGDGTATVAGTHATVAGTPATGARATASVGAAFPSRGRVRGRVLAGTAGFVLGFTVVFTLLATAATGIGSALATHQDVLQRVVGILVILMGVAYLGLIPATQRELRFRWLPATGVAGAPLLGAVFALGWVPCLGPTLTAVLGLVAVQGSFSRGTVLIVAYCLGLGIPFVLFGLGLRRLLGAVAFMRRHTRTVARIGGVLLIVVGVLLAAGLWNDIVIWLRSFLPPGEIGI